VILRGQLTVDDDEAGHAKEQAIEDACRDDRWTQAVIDCVAGQPHPQDCLDKLAEAQRGTYDDRIATWRADYEPSGSTGTAMRTAFVDCADILRDGAIYPPALDNAAPQYDWQLRARAGVLDEACDHDWSDSLKECIQLAGTDSAKIGECLVHELGADEADAFTKQLRDISTLAAAIAKAKAKPASITCTKVVTAHYRDAAWKNQLGGYAAAARKQMIAASRTLMTSACTAGKWSDTTRACIVAGGDDACFDGTDKRRWGYPATGAVTKVGITECDDYSDAVLKLTSCQAIPQSAKDSILRSQQQMLAEIARVPPADRAKMGSSCMAAMEAIEQTVATAGC
jgi:hypothetical protein